MSGIGRRLLVKTAAIAGGNGLVFVVALLAARCSRTANADESAKTEDPIASAAHTYDLRIATCERDRQRCLADRPAAHSEARYAKWHACEVDYASCSAPAAPR